MKCVLMLSSEWMDKDHEDEYLEIIIDKYPLLQNFNLHCDWIDCIDGEFKDKISIYSPLIDIENFKDIFKIIDETESAVIFDIFKRTVDGEIIPMIVIIDGDTNIKKG